MGFILSKLASLLFAFVGVINFPIVLIIHAKKRGFWRVTNKYWRSDAYELDVFGNYRYRATWNLLFRKKDGYKFGEKSESISSALGKNKRDATLSLFGKIIAGILDALDKNHCIKSIND
jgi:hypothetical protein